MVRPCRIALCPTRFPDMLSRRETEMRRYLLADMDTGTCRFEPLPQPLAPLGGRALASFLAAQIPGSLCFAPGILAGCRAASAGRCSVSCVSDTGAPDGSVLHSNAGGAFGYALASAGLPAVVIRGGKAAPTPAESFILLIRQGSASLEPCLLPCLGVADTMREMTARWPDAAALVTVGPAALHSLPMASLEFSDSRLRPGGHAGGGAGAALFHKGLRGIVVLGTKSDVPAADPEGLKNAARRFLSALKELRGSIPASKGGCSPHCALGCHHKKDSTAPDGKSDRSGKGGAFKWPGFSEYWSCGDEAANDANTRRFASLCDDLGADAFILARIMMQAADNGLLEKGRADHALAELEKLIHAPESSALYAPAMACTEKRGRKNLNEDVQDVIMDCLGICRFAADAMLLAPETRDAVWDMVRCMHGLAPANANDMAAAVLAVEHGPEHP